jgi:hypothetical protein
MQEQDRPGFEPPAAGVHDAAADPAAQTGADEVIAGPSRRRVSAGVVVAAVGIGALGIAGAAYAAASDPSPAPSGSGYAMPGDRDGDGPQGYGMPGQPGMGAPGLQGRPGDGQGHGPGHGVRGPGMGIHGTFVVPQPDGSGYQTVHMQRGEVTAVSASSITVTSEDGYSKTYVVDAATEVNRDGAIGDIEVGASVMVVGVAGDDSVTATRVVDASTMPAMGDRDGDGPHGDDDGDGPLAPPSPDGTA